MRSRSSPARDKGEARPKSPQAKSLPRLCSEKNTRNWLRKTRCLTHCYKEIKIGIWRSGNITNGR